MPKYYRPTTRADALAALAEGGAGARPLVGGTDLLVGLRHHTLEPDLLVDLKAVTDLPEPIAVDDEGMRFGATCTLGELVEHPVVREWYPALVEAALTVGSVAIRNRASLVANSCNASPAADTAPPLLVHGARVTIASLDGDRTAALDDFFLGPRRTLCGPGELVTRIELPRPAPGSGAAFRRLTRRRGVDLATVSVAAGVGPDGALVLGMGAVGPRPLRAEVPGPVDLDDEASLAPALDRLLAAATPISDVRGSREYRLATLRVLTTRAVRTAASRRNPREMAS
ncbi:FAD binding domain-containing protein [Blastococcus tunisiensis]|uniref:Carbon-monoxide dehydrogenase medium subunit n=1 Tax=Blastococcus tunisiensis TaxID=1798228 RepID=A0A1I2BP90_9ACTN|nr:xanthine dehydrogenase family protein subunit M [Blastococcus sp. DSM 46838]SFE57931.1 carbon-monoxide dehydrogenase medium subunit [Blastococcus sp. DSM 46838]